MTQQWIIFQATVNAFTVNQMQETIATAINQGVEELFIIISSGGGSVFHGMSLATLINACPVPVTIINAGQVDSVSNVVFSAGKKRMATANASFLFHGVQAGFGANTQLTEKQLTERLLTVTRDRENIAKLIGGYTGVDEKKIADMMEQGVILSASEAKTMGLFHEIIPKVEIPKDAKVFVVQDAQG